MNERKREDFFFYITKKSKDLVVLPGGQTVGSVISNVAPDIDAMTLDSLGMNDGETFGRFDKWNALYLPFQDDAMRQTFLRRENLSNGCLYAGLIKEVANLQDHLVFTEMRLTVRGSHASEFSELAKWVSSNELDKLPRNRWVIQVPRAYRVLFRKGLVKSFGELLENLFRPLFEVTIEPSRDECLYDLAFSLGGFDSVDDESHHESVVDFQSDPYQWTTDVEVNRKKKEEEKKIGFDSLFGL